MSANMGEWNAVKASNMNGYISNPDVLIHCLLLGAIIESIKDLEECLWSTEYLCDTILNLNPTICLDTSCEDHTDPCPSPAIPDLVKIMQIHLSGWIALNKFGPFRLEVLG
jgi:hypothetical protein